MHPSRATSVMSPGCPPWAVFVLPARSHHEVRHSDSHDMKPAGYSGTPLAQKLGIAANSTVVARYAPDNYRALLEPVPAGAIFESTVSPATDIVHLFAERKRVLEAELAVLRSAIRPNGVVWVSWPKKASKLPTDITEDTIRELALPLGFVDVKVCAVDAIWSGLKLVIRKELR